MRFSAAVFLLILAVSGCSSETPVPPVDPATSLNGVTVDVSVPERLRMAERSRLQLDEWTARTGGVFEINEVADESAASVPAPKTALAVVGFDQVPDLFAAEWPAVIDDSEALADWGELFRGLRSGFTEPAGQPRLIPTSCPVLAVYYRADLLEAAGREPPQTWDDYQTLLNDLADWSGGLPAVEPWSPGFRSSMWLARAAGYALHPDSVSILLDLQQGEPLISGPPFVQTLEDTLSALKSLDPQSRRWGPAECCQAVLDGRAALAIGIASPEGFDESGSAYGESDPESAVGTAALPGASEVYERATDAWLPTADPSRVTVVGYGGYAVCVSRTVDKQAHNAAWNLWSALRSRDDADDLPFGPAVCRAPDVPAAQLRPAPGFSAGEWREHLSTTVGALQDTRVLLELPLPEAARFREALTRRLDAAIDGAATPADALQQAATDWRTLIDELGRERVLNAYRLCHGLAPL